MKALRVKLVLKLHAIIEIMSTDKFDLITYENGVRNERIKFSKKKIDRSFKPKKKH